MIAVKGIWGWTAAALLIVSPAIGNLYRFAGDRDYMAAVRLFVLSVALLAALYGILLCIRDPRIVNLALTAVLLAGLWVAPDIAASASEYSTDVKLTILLCKVITAVVVLLIYVSFLVTELFERVAWAILLGLEGYSALQYLLCKVAPGGNLDPSLYLEWGDPLAKSACSRAFGPVMAYADVAICAVLMCWAVWRWRRAK